MNMILTSMAPISEKSLDKALDIFGDVTISFDNTDFKLKVEKIVDVTTIYRATLYVETSSIGYYDLGYIERNFIDEIINTITIINKFSKRRNF